MRVIALLSLLVAAITVPSSVSAYTVAFFNVTSNVTNCDALTAASNPTPVSQFNVPTQTRYGVASCYNIPNNGGSVLLDCTNLQFQYTPKVANCPVISAFDPTTIDFLSFQTDPSTSVSCYQNTVNGVLFQSNPNLNSTSIPQNILIAIDCTGAPKKNTATTLSTMTAVTVAAVSAVAAKLVL